MFVKSERRSPNEKNGSKEELIVRKNTVRLTEKQELLVKQKKGLIIYGQSCGKKD